MKKDTYGFGEYYLGLQYSDTTPKQAHQPNQVFFLSPVGFENFLALVIQFSAIFMFGMNLLGTTE